MTRIVHADELPLGACVARDVLSGLPAAAPLLRAGAVVTAGFQSALERLGVSFVCVDDELSAGSR